MNRVLNSLLFGFLLLSLPVASADENHDPAAPATKADLIFIHKDQLHEYPLFAVYQQRAKVLVGRVEALQKDLDASTQMWLKERKKLAKTDEAEDRLDQYESSLVKENIPVGAGQAHRYRNVADDPNSVLTIAIREHSLPRRELMKAYIENAEIYFKAKTLIPYAEYELKQFNDLCQQHVDSLIWRQRPGWSRTISLSLKQTSEADIKAEIEKAGSNWILVGIRLDGAPPKSTAATPFTRLFNKVQFNFTYMRKLTGSWLWLGLERLSNRKIPIMDGAAGKIKQRSKGVERKSVQKKRGSRDKRI